MADCMDPRRLCIHNAYAEVCRVARSEAGSVEDLTTASVQGAAISLTRTGRGVDPWSSVELPYLPIQAYVSSCSLLCAIERAIQLPLQALLNLIVFLAKPDSGERLVTLTPLVYAIWAKARGAALLEWDASRSRFWDTAVKWSSALRAAILRRCADGIGH